MPVIARITRDDFPDPELALSQQKLWPAQVTPSQLWYQVWDESLSGDGCGGIFVCCGKYLFVVSTRDNTCGVTAAQPWHRQTWQNTDKLYPTSLWSLLTRLRIIKFAFLIPKYLGSDHIKDSCEVPDSPLKFYFFLKTISNKQIARCTHKM